MRTIAAVCFMGLAVLGQQLETLPLESAAARESYRSIVRRLAAHRTSVEWKDETIQNVVRTLRNELRLNFVLDPALRERSREPEVNLTLQDVSAASILALLESSLKITFQHRNGILYVTTPEEAMKKAMVLSFYSIRDMLYVPPDFVAPRLGLKPGPIEEPVRDPEPPEQKDPAFLEDLIRQSVGAVLWEVEGASITIHNGTLVVRHTPKVQAQVRSLISRLRGVF